MSEEAKDEINIHQTAVVSQAATIKGNVTIGAGSVVHPNAAILATGGPIDIGPNNIIEECVVIETNPTANQNSGMILKVGSFNTFEVGCRVESTMIGDGNVIGAKASLGVLSSITDGVTVAPHVKVPEKMHLPDNTVLFGCEHSMRTVPNGKALNTANIDARLANQRKVLSASGKVRK